MRKQRTSLWKTFNRHGRISIFRVSTILVVIIAILMYLSNGYQQAQIQYSYCGDFGFYGKSLTLMKDNTFRFNYHGCSQTNGYVSGKWIADKEMIILQPNQPDEHLDAQYRQADNRLLPMTLKGDNGFISCNDYVPGQGEEEE